MNMANLYLEVESERTSKHQIGNRFLEVKIYYGNKCNPKLLTHILVKHDNSTPQFFQYNTVKPKPFIKETQK
jgi:hypothetical protein